MIELSQYKPSDLQPILGDLQEPLRKYMDGVDVALLSERLAKAPVAITGKVGENYIGAVFLIPDPDDSSTAEAVLMTTTAVRRHMREFDQAYADILEELEEKGVTITARINDDFPAYHNWVRRHGFQYRRPTRDMFGREAKEYVKWGLIQSR